MHENEIGTLIVDSAVHLHQDLGPGLLETVYEVTLAAKLRKRGLSVERQVPISIEYEGQRFDEGWHHANRLRRVMSPSPWLCGSVALWLCENQKSEQGGAPERAIRAFSDGKSPAPAW